MKNTLQLVRVSAAHSEDVLKITMVESSSTKQPEGFHDNKLRNISQLQGSIPSTRDVLIVGKVSLSSVVGVQETGCCIKTLVRRVPRGWSE